MDESSLIYEDFQSVAPHSGKTNLLVVLIDLEPGNTEDDKGYEKIEWNSDFIKRANDYFFGKREDTPNSWNSLKTYFETTSLNALEISGIVADVYKADPNKYTMRSILNSYRPYRALHEVFVDAIHHIQETRSDVDWSSFDRNDDGYLDNLHFITNASYNTTRMGEYGRSLWPHKYELEISETPNLDYPVGKVYETTSLGHFTDPNTIIHEQGHVFGIPDYYDYGYTGADYIGCYDMQSHNVFDWNAFSKFTVGWAKPYVVNGEAETTTIKLNSSALTNECIVIPANHNKYNGSAFDEYFLLELYTMDGNNAYDWKRFYGAYTTAAIKIFHVDARLYDIWNRKVPTIDEVLNSNKDQVVLGTNNSYNYKDYAGGYANPNWGDFKTLAIMQNGGVNTFGELDGNSPTSYDYLSMKDLFHTGNSFEFKDYSHFLSKTGKTVTTMDNGDTFPYRITIQNIKNTEAIITIAKI
jgi:M6 family metalloprotease-like protein